MVRRRFVVPDTRGFDSLNSLWATSPLIRGDPTPELPGSKPVGALRGNGSAMRTRVGE